MKVFSKIRFMCVIFLFISILNLCAKEDPLAMPKCKGFYVVTIPKSGTHLVMKLISMLTNHKASWQWISSENTDSLDDSQIKEHFLDLKNQNLYHLTHMRYSLVCQKFSELNPDYVKIMLIRDLRDVLVSTVYYYWDRLENKFGPSTFNQKLMLFLENKNIAPYPYVQAQIAAEWINDPEVVISRFEDLVGEGGGGSLQQQEKAILHLANNLGISLDTIKLNEITTNLFGKEYRPEISGTFRKGQIGSWKHHFTPEHVRYFKKHWGPLQLALGYRLE